MKKTYTIKTLGCKVNQFESDVIRKAMHGESWEEKDGDGVDLCIINTCSVTGKAAMQSRQAIRQTLRNNPGARIIVTGCYAQTAPEEIRSITGIDAIVGHSNKYRIPDLIAALPAGAPDAPEIHIEDIRRESEFRQSPLLPESNRTRPFLKIQDGCDAFCAYCIVPHARGRGRSMPLPDVLDNIRRLRQRGYREVVLTGINLGTYGKDLPAANGRLVDLLRQIDAQQLIERVRLSSIEPLEIPPQLIDIVSTAPVICDHFHIPLQSGDDAILSKMRRPYTVAQYRNVVERIYKCNPEIAIGADVLVGFPGESDTAFENTRALLESLPLAYLHVFPFSPRPGTTAERYAGRIPIDVIKARAEIIRGIGHEKQKHFCSRFLDRRVRVLTETRKSAEGRLKGITSNYIAVVFAGPDSLMNRFADVTVARWARNRTVVGALDFVAASQ